MLQPSFSLKTMPSSNLYGTFHPHSYRHKGSYLLGGGTSPFMRNEGIALTREHPEIKPLFEKNMEGKDINSMADIQNAIEQSQITYRQAKQVEIQNEYTMAVANYAKDTSLKQFFPDEVTYQKFESLVMRDRIRTLRANREPVSRNFYIDHYKKAKLEQEQAKLIPDQKLLPPAKAEMVAAEKQALVSKSNNFGALEAITRNKKEILVKDVVEPLKELQHKLGATPYQEIRKITGLQKLGKGLPLIAGFVGLDIIGLFLMIMDLCLDTETATDSSGNAKTNDLVILGDELTKGLNIASGTIKAMIDDEINSLVATKETILEKIKKVGVAGIIIGGGLFATLIYNVYENYKHKHPKGRAN